METYLIRLWGKKDKELLIPLQIFNFPQTTINYNEIERRKIIMDQTWRPMNSALNRLIEWMRYLLNLMK